MNKRKILVTGSLGQIGSELVMYLRKEYGNDNVIASDIEKKDVPKVIGSGPFEKLDVLKANKTLEICKKYGVNTVIHLAALLSAVAEKNPKLAYDINMNGLYNMLEIAREQNYTLFVPSSIAAFGPSTLPIKLLKIRFSARLQCTELQRLQVSFFAIIIIKNSE